MNEKQTPQSGLLFSKGFIKFSAGFLLVILLLMAFLHWQKGDYHLEAKPEAGDSTKVESSY